MVYNKKNIAEHGHQYKCYKNLIPVEYNIENRHPQYHINGFTQFSVSVIDFEIS